MSNTLVTKLFEVIDDTASILQHDHSVTYLEAIVETGENLFQGDVTQTVDEVTRKRLLEIYRRVTIGHYTKEEIRKAIQLAVLKGMKEAVQPHHAMTPDSVALFIGYLATKWSKGKEPLRLLDPVVGTGNLLTAVLNRLSQRVSAFAVEADETLLKIAYVNANLQSHPIELFHGDAVQPLLIDPVDMVVADLPVGFYPNDDIAASFDLREENGHSFIHYLLVEQSLHYAKEGAVLFFLVPNTMLQPNETKRFNKWLNNHAVIQSILQLPLSLFKNDSQAKSIVVLQKKGKHTKVPKQVLLAKLPSFSNQRAMARAISEIEDWFDEIEQLS